MNSILEVDLNDFVSRRFAEEMEAMQSHLDAAQREIAQKRGEAEKWKLIARESSKATYLLDLARKNFSEIKAGEPDSSGWYDSKQKRQFVFIAQLMLDLFGIENKVNWLSSCGDGSLKVYLAVAYYENKSEIKSLVEMLTPDHGEITRLIDSFVMPRDYGREDVLAYVKKPHYCTNGAIYGISQYWIEGGAKHTNMPHNLIMENGHILEDDIFEELLSTVASRASNYFYLFALPKYNKNITDEQVSRLGECLIGLKPTKDDTINDFIKDNIRKFNNKTLDFLFQYINSESQYSSTFWLHFPDEYQKRYLSGMSISKAINKLYNYNCDLSEDDRVSILRDVLAKESSGIAEKQP